MAQCADRRAGSCPGVTESDDCIMDPAAVVGVRRWDGDSLNAGDHVSSQCQRESSGVLVVVEIAGAGPRRADLVQHHVAEEVAGSTTQPSLTAVVGSR